MEIISLGAGDEDRYREIRLRALKEAPKAFASTFEREEAFDREVWTSRLTGDAVVNLLALDDGRPVGMTSARIEEKDAAQLLGMWVAPEARGREVGRLLIEEVVRWAREHHLGELGLWVTETNQSARALYEKNGFRPTGGRQPLPSDPSLMEIELVRGTLLADRTPFPEDLDGRLREQFTFLVEVDQLKAILRQSPLAAVRRRENDAEHSWHLAMMVVILAEYSDEPIDVGHTVQLVLVHDLVEIYAGDTPLYDTEAGVDQREREVRAADELFAILPGDQARRLRRLWDEFEERRTPEARFAKAMDRLQPLLLNWMDRGGTWRTPGVTADDVRARKAVIGDASAALWKAGRHLIDEGERRGWSRLEAQGEHLARPLADAEGLGRREPVAPVVRDQPSLTARVTVDPDETGPLPPRLLAGVGQQRRADPAPREGPVRDQQRDVELGLVRRVDVGLGLGRGGHGARGGPVDLGDPDAVRADPLRDPLQTLGLRREGLGAPLARAAVLGEPGHGPVQHRHDRFGVFRPARTDDHHRLPASEA